MPEDVSRFRKGVELLKSGRFEEAIQELEVAATTGEDLPVEHFALAVAYEKSGSAAAAMEEYERFLLMKPTDANKVSYATQHLAKLRAVAPPNEGAAPTQEITSARQASPSAGAAVLAAGERSLAAGDVDSAMAHYQRAVDADPSSADSWAGLGKATYLKGLRSALTFYEKAASLSAAGTAAWFNVGSIATLLGEAEKARRAFMRVVEIDPSDAEARERLSQL